MSSMTTVMQYALGLPADPSNNCQGSAVRTRALVFAMHALASLLPLVGRF